MIPALVHFIIDFECGNCLHEHKHYRAFLVENAALVVFCDNCGVEGKIFL